MDSNLPGQPEDDEITASSNVSLRIPPSTLPTVEEPLKASKPLRVRFFKPSVGLGVVGCVLVALGAVFGVMYGASQLSAQTSKDSSVVGGVLRTKGGDAVQTASTLYTIGPTGMLQSRTTTGIAVLLPVPANLSGASGNGKGKGNSSGSKATSTVLSAASKAGGRLLAVSSPRSNITVQIPIPVSSAEALVYAPIASTIGLSALSGLKSLVLVSPTGFALVLQVTGVVLQSTPLGVSILTTPPALTIITQYGHILCVGTALYYTDDSQEGLFAAAGFPVQPPAIAPNLVGAVPNAEGGMRYEKSYSATPSSTPTKAYVPSPAPQRQLLSDSLTTTTTTTTRSTAAAGDETLQLGGRAFLTLEEALVGTLSSHATTNHHPFHGGRRLISTLSAVGTFSASVLTSLALNNDPVGEHSFPTAPTPPPTFLPAIRIQPLPTTLLHTPSLYPGWLPPTSSSSSSSSPPTLRDTSYGGGYWLQLLQSLCANSSSTPPTLSIPLYLFAGTGSSQKVAGSLANASLGFVPVTLNCYRSTLTISNFTLPNALLLGGGISIPSGGATLTATATMHYRLPQTAITATTPSTTIAAAAANATGLKLPPLTCSTNTFNTPNSSSLCSFTWLWKGVIATTRSGVATMGGVQGSQVSVTIADALAPGGGATRASFSFFEPATPASPIGVTATLSVGVDPQSGCFSARGPAVVRAVFRAGGGWGGGVSSLHNHSGGGDVVFRQCYGVQLPQWSLEGVTLGGFGRKGEYGALAFATPSLPLVGGRSATNRLGNWTGTARGLALFAGAVVNASVVIVGGGEGSAVSLAFTDVASDSGESFFLAASALDYTYSTTSCGRALGGLGGSWALLPPPYTPIPGTGTLDINTCLPSSSSSSSRTWSASLSLGSFTLLGQAFTSGALNASRSSGRVRWGGLSFSGKALLGGGLPATVVGRGIPTSITPLGGWAFNASVAQIYTPGSFVNFSGSGPLTLSPSQSPPEVTMSATLPLGATVFLNTPTSPSAAGSSMNNASAVALQTGPGTLTFNSTSGVISATLHTTVALQLGPATLLPGSTLTLSLAPATSSGMGAMQWSVGLSGNGSVGTSITMTSFEGTATSPATLSGSGTLNVTFSQGGNTTIPHSSVLGGLLASHVMPSAKYSVSADGSATFGYDAQAPLCPFKVQSVGSVSLYVYGTLFPAPISFSGGVRAGPASSGPVTLTYTCPSTGGVGGGWGVSFTTPLFTPAYSYTSQRTLALVDVGGTGNVGSSTLNTTYYVPAVPGWVVGKVFNLTSAHVTATTGSPTPTHRDWRGAFVGMGSFITEPDVGLTLTAAFQTAVHPYSLDITASVYSAPQGTTIPTPMALAGTLTLTHTLVPPTSMEGSKWAMCFNGSGRLNATASLPFAGGMRSPLYGPNATITYASCAPHHWAVSSTLRGGDVALDGEGVFSPSSFKAYGGAFGGSGWTVLANGTLSLGGGQLACPATASLNAFSLNLSCLPTSNSSIFMGSSTSTTTTSTTNATSLSIVTLSNPITTPSIPNATASPCLTLSTLLPTLNISLPASGFHASVPNANLTYTSPSCGMGGTTTTTTTTTGKGIWQASTLNVPGFSLGDILLSSVTLQVASAPSTAATTTWALSGAASAVLSLNSSMGASPAAVTLGTQGTTFTSTTLTAFITATIALPGTLTMAVNMTMAASGYVAMGSCEPWVGVATGSLHFTQPPYAFSALPLTYNPCTTALVVGGGLSQAPSITVSTGSVRWVANTLSLAWRPKSGAGWTGFLGGYSTTPTLPLYLPFSGSTTLASLAPLTSLPSGIALPLPGFGLALLPNVTSTAGGSVCGAGATPLYALPGLSPGGVLTSMSNLPMYLPPLSSLRATLFFPCNPSQWGGYSLNSSTPFNFSFAFRGTAFNLTHGNVTVTKASASAPEVYIFQGRLHNTSATITFSSLGGVPTVAFVNKTFTVRGSSSGARRAGDNPMGAYHVPAPHSPEFDEHHRDLQYVDDDSSSSSSSSTSSTLVKLVTYQASNCLGGSYPTAQKDLAAFVQALQGASVSVLNAYASLSSGSPSTLPSGAPLSYDTPTGVYTNTSAQLPTQCTTTEVSLGSLGGTVLNDLAMFNPTAKLVICLSPATSEKTCRVSMDLDVTQGTLPGWPSFVGQFLAPYLPLPVPPSLLALPNGVFFNGNAICVGANALPVLPFLVINSVQACFDATLAVSGSATATVSGFPVGVVFARNPVTESKGEWNVTIYVDSDSATGTFMESLPFSIGGSINLYSPYAIGNLTKLSLRVGTRTFTLPQGCCSPSSPFPLPPLPTTTLGAATLSSSAPALLGTISLSLPNMPYLPGCYFFPPTDTWYFTATLPGASFGGLVVVGDTTFGALVVGGALQAATLSGSLSLGGDIVGANLAVTLSPRKSKSAPTAYSVQAAGSVSTPVLSGYFVVTLGRDSEGCSTFSGTMVSLTLNLGSDAVALTIGNLVVTHDACACRWHVYTTPPGGGSLTVEGLTIALTGLDVTRSAPPGMCTPGADSGKGATWAGSVQGSITLLDLPGDWVSTQSAIVNFNGLALSSLYVAFSLSNPGWFSLNATLSYTSPNSPACAYALDTGTAQLWASVPLPGGGSTTLSGLATVSRACSGGPVTTVLQWTAPIVIDLGVSSVTLTGVTLTLVTGGGGKSKVPVRSSLTLSGNVQGSEFLRVSLDVSIGTGGPSIVLSASLDTPASLGALLGGVGGGEDALLGPLQGVADSMLSGVTGATVTELQVSLVFGGASQGGKCLYMWAALENLFGVSAGVASKLCFPKTGSLAVSIPLAGIGNLPVDLQPVTNYFSPVTFNLGFGARAIGASVGPVTFPSAMPRLVLPSSSSSSLIPTLYGGLPGLCFAGSLSAIASGFTDMVSQFSQATGGGTTSFSSTLNSALAQDTYITACLNGVTDFTVSLNFAPGDEGTLQFSSGVSLLQAAFYATVSKSRREVGISATILADTGDQTLESSGFLALTLTPPGLEVGVAFALSQAPPPAYGNWVNPFGISPQVSISMPIMGILGVVFVEAPPFIVPREIGFSGGVWVGDSGFNITFHCDIDNLQNTILELDAQNLKQPDPVAVISSLAPSAFADSLATVLRAMLPPVYGGGEGDPTSIGGLHVSFNPLPQMFSYHLTVGTITQTIDIPTGLAILLQDVNFFSLFTITKAYLYISPTGLSMGTTLAPFSIGGFSVVCGGAGCTGGPGFSLDANSGGGTACLQGTMIIPGTNAGSWAADIFPWPSGGLSTSVSGCINTDASIGFSAQTPSSISDYVVLGLGTSGNLNDPDHIVVSVTFKLGPGLLDKALGPIEDYLSDTENFVNGLNPGSQLLDLFNNAVATAKQTYNQATKVVDDAIAATALAAAEAAAATEKAAEEAAAAAAQAAQDAANAAQNAANQVGNFFKGCCRRELGEERHLQTQQQLADQQTAKANLNTANANLASFTNGDFTARITDLVSTIKGLTRVSITSFNLHLPSSFDACIQVGDNSICFTQSFTPPIAADDLGKACAQQVYNWIMDNTAIGSVVNGLNGLNGIGQVFNIPKP